MRQDIHPEYHFIEVVMTDGTTYKTRTTWGSEGEQTKLLIDPKNHPAYTGIRKMMDTEGRAEKLRKKYGM